jgi:hypothetical protein
MVIAEEARPRSRWYANNNEINIKEMGFEDVVLVHVVLDRD